ncbi:MAG: amino acid adenylation domain-containing protein [Alphaproteobacteria bacterium]
MNKYIKELTLNQNEIWTEQLKIGLEKTPFNNSCFFELRENLDAAIVEKTLLMSLKLHDVFSAILKKGKNGVLFEYGHSNHFEISHLDFSKEKDPLSYALDFCRIESIKPFASFYDKPLYFFYIIKLAENYFGIFYKMHQIIADGQGVVNACNSFLKCLKSLKNQEAPDDVIQYDNFIEYQKQYLASDNYQKDLDFFLDYYKKNNEYLFTKSPSIQNISPQETIYHYLSKDFYNDLNQKCKDCQITVNSLLTTVTYLASKTLYNNDNFRFSYVTSNRRKKEHKDIVAPMSESRVLVSKLGDKTNIIEIAQEIRRNIIACSRHLNCPTRLTYQYIYDKLNTVPSPPDFSINYITTPLIKDYDAVIHYIPSGAIFFPYTITYFDTFGHDGAFIRLEYLPKMLSKEEVDAFFKTFLCILNAFILEGEISVNSLIKQASEKYKEEIKLAHKFNLCAKRKLTDDEKLDLIAKGKGQKVENPNFKNIVDYIEFVNRDNLDIPAIISSHKNDQETSYRDLFKISDNIAHHLKNKGLKTGDVVAVCLEKDEFVPILLFAILKAGGVYMAVDNKAPSDRILFMLNDANAKFCFTDKSTLNDKKIPKETAILIQDLDLGKDSPHFLCKASLEDNAYLLYTSGSTGTPKGALISHKNILSTIKAIFNNVDFPKNYKCFSVGSYAFDAFGLDFYGTFFNNGSLVIAPDFVAMSAQSLIDHIDKYKPDIVFSGPVLCRLLLSHNWKGSPNLNLVTGGEVLTNDIAENILPLTKSVFNIYGPTETTIGVTMHKVSELDAKQKSVPIGAPINNTALLVVDENLELVPYGQTGELLIGGGSVGNGYLNRPDLTSKRFITTPYGEGIFYRTGDLVYWNENGHLVFVGRNDFQVKIRSIRIEIEEIEQKIKQSLGDKIEQAIITVHRNDAGENELCAWIKTNEKLNIADINSKISSFLPLQMLPKYINIIDEFPISTTGKIDRQKLTSMPVNSYTETAENTYSFKTELEKQIADIWCEVIGVKNISPDSNFFELGGNSLQVATIVQKMEDQFNIKISLSTVFDFPVFSAFVSLIKGENNTDETIKSIFADILKINPSIITDSTSFFELGGDSLTIGILLEKINQEFKTKINIIDLFDKSNLLGIKELIASKSDYKD